MTGDPGTEPTPARSSPSRGQVSSIRRGADLDRLAILEEERDHLLASMRDLDRELAAGDIDADDHATLRDGYTVRAAEVLRDIDVLEVRLGLAEGQAPDGDRSADGSAVDGSAVDGSAVDGTGRPGSRPDRSRTTRRVLTWVAVVAIAVAIGFALASAFGERRTGQEITGSTPGDDARARLVEARLALGNADFVRANQLFFQVDQLEQERGVDNAEARAYFGWTLALVARGEADPVQSERLTDAAALALSQAAEMDPTYPDPRCFLAIVEFQFRGDATAALPHVEFCEANDPPAEVAELIGAFADEIRAAL